MKREFRQLRLSQLQRLQGRAEPHASTLRRVDCLRARGLGLSQRQVGKKVRASGQAKLALLSARNQRGCAWNFTTYE
jgi:hypothetical protein